MPLSCYISPFPVLEKPGLEQVCTASILAEKEYSGEQETFQSIWKPTFVDLVYPG